MTTTTTSTVGDWSGTRFAHEACVFSEDDAMRRRVIPFIEEGLERKEAVIVVAGDTVRTAIADSLGPACDSLDVLADSEGFWQGGPETLATYNESMRPLLEAGRPWRLVGEPTWLTRPGGEAWSRYEAVANDAFAGYPYYSLCLHDRRRLSPHLVENALRTHPLTWDGEKVVPSPDYQPTAAFLRSVEPPWTPAPEARESATVTSLAAARHVVRSAIRGGLAGERADDVVLAVHELVANAVEAAGAAEVSHWRADGSEVWEVRDHGPGMHETAAGYAPPPLDLSRGRGLWLARSLADEATVRPYGPGTAIRLFFDES